MPKSTVIIWIIQKILSRDTWKNDINIIILTFSHLADAPEKKTETAYRFCFDK